MHQTLLQVWCMLYSANTEQCANTKTPAHLYTHIDNEAEYLQVQYYSCPSFPPN